MTNIINSGYDFLAKYFKRGTSVVLGDKIPSRPVGLTNEEDAAYDSLEEIPWYDDSSIEFILNRNEDNYIKNYKLDMTYTDKWKEIKNEVIDFLEDKSNIDFIIRIVSAEEGEKVPGFFELRTGQYATKKNIKKGILTSCNEILKKSIADSYPMRIEFWGVEGISLSNKKHAQIRNYNECGDVGDISWEEFSPQQYS